MKRNPWPYAIIGYFVIFISGVVSWIVFAVHHEDQLVRSDYYEQEIRFQLQIDSAVRTAAVQKDVHIIYNAATQSVSIQLPAGHSALRPSGQVLFYRPSDAALDKELPLNIKTDGSQRINVADLKAGFWKVRLAWSAGGADYYCDQPIVLEK